ncbi:MAG TPA: TonB-dependent receptor [Hyphomicrobiaceae bacterium]|nr:TonB-dependent receptor [Hyphomicrobiaceae bacterium]
MTEDHEMAGANADTRPRPVDKRLLGQVSLGIASMLLASGASAQTTLPALSVQTKKAPPKAKARAKAKQSAPVAATPTPAAPVLLADPADAVPGPPASPSNSLDAGTGIGRLPGTIQDTPQTVNVIGQTQLREENVNTLEQALRSVPGVTVAIGEGGGGMNGDQFRIRGFQAKGDIYVDGLRDFGVYVRDSFAYEQVQVLKGPSSEAFGMGTTGGAINIQQKTAHLGDAASFDVTVGTGPMARTTVDINKQINNTTAARIVGMWHDQDIVDRDHLYSDRWGFLASLAFGLGTDEKFTINYLHQSGKRKPDMGVPIFDPDGTAGPLLGKPVTEFGVSRKNFYGKETDIDDSDVDMITARYMKRVNEHLTIQNDTRLAMYGRYWAQTVVNCNTGSACGDSILDGTLTGAYGFGGPAGFDQESWGIQNITTAIAKFHTGWLRHEFVAGIDVFYQNDARTQLANSVAKTAGTIGNPLYTNPPGFSVDRNPLARKKADSDNIAFFASDRVWLTPEFSILGGLRWDRFSAAYRATDTSTGLWAGCTPAPTPTNPTAQTCAIDTDSSTSFWSPKASVIWEPTKQQTYYISYAKSYSSLAGQFITNDNNSIGNDTMEPEENKLWEAGLKWSLLDGKLGFTAALFRVDKTNATVDDGTGAQVPTGEEQRVQGVELGLTGQLTSAWTIQAAYAYMDSEILYNAATTGNNPVAENQNKGNRVAFVPEHAVSVWSTVEISKIMNLWPGKTTIGGGIRWSDDIYANSGNTSIIPANFTFDALISYEKDGWRFAANGYNLTDELNYDASFGNRAVVAAGRTLMFTVGKKF